MYLKVWAHNTALSKLHLCIPWEEQYANVDLHADEDIARGSTERVTADLQAVQFLC